MAGRTVRAGFIVFTDKSGRPATGYLGDKVDVHKDDIDRFDRLNPAEPDKEPQEKKTDEVKAPAPYHGVTVVDLKALLEERNKDRDDGDKISPAEPGNRPEIVAALVADDEKQQS